MRFEEGGEAVRKYSVEEIDQMRSAIEFQWLFGCKPKDAPQTSFRNSRTYMEEEKVKCVEELLRTYMLAGVSPEELEGEGRP